METAIPVHILTGFLGSGKTTLLTQTLEYYRSRGYKPAVLMNELGDVNLDGLLVESEVPMTELLGGCICCTSRGDLGLELKQLIEEYAPDVVFVESTGAANPIELLDGVTDASLLTRADLRSIVTVVDARHVLERSASPKARTYKLMEDQIRCATVLILNKTDLVSEEELDRLQTLLRELNAAAPIVPSVRCSVDLAFFDRASGLLRESVPHHGAHDAEAPHQHDHGPDGCAVCGESAGAHHSHDHVMAYTHYFSRPVDSEAFEALVGRLPAEIFRAKGILRFTDTVSPFLFQYAYREMDFIKVAPKEELPNVAVFIGEHFDKSALAEQLLELEREAGSSQVG